MKTNSYASPVLAPSKESLVKKSLILVYGVVCYLIFFAAILYLIGFSGNLLVPKGVDSGHASSLVQVIVSNLLLVLLFGFQHSIMARPAFKAWITRYIPQPMERSTFVLVSSLMMTLLYWKWQPIAGVIWHIENTAGVVVMYTLFGIGWSLLFISTFLIDHFELFGLKQVFQQARTYELVHPTFRTPLLYKIVRHPMMIGIIIGLWATPLMTVGHMFFSFCMTIYILIGIHYEEKDLVKTFGKQYEVYQKRVPKIIPGI